MTLGAPKPTHFLVPGRILSRAPEDPGAQVLVLMQMAMAGILPGCIGSEPNAGHQDISPGLREIRLDYGGADSASSSAETNPAAEG